MEKFPHRAGGATGAATGAFAITPADDAELAIYPRALSVATAGIIHVDTLEGEENIDIFVAAGVMFPQRVKKVYATGTTAGGIRGHY